MDGKKRFCASDADEKRKKRKSVTDAVDAYRFRRKARLDARRFRADAEEEGEWRTTDNGHKILIEDGAVVGGNPRVRRYGQETYWRND